MMLQPLPIPIAHFRSRWVWLDENRPVDSLGDLDDPNAPNEDEPETGDEDPEDPEAVIHRVATIEKVLWRDEAEEWTIGQGRTVCGRWGSLMMPGVLGRLSALRCEECCRHMNITAGRGNPRNDRIPEPGDLDSPLWQPSQGEEHEVEQ